MNLLLSQTCSPATLATFRHCLASLRTLNLTTEELPCVKALLLFQGDSGNPRLFEQAQLGLARVCNADQSAIKFVRFARILNTISSIRVFNSRSVHAIFFADRIPILGEEVGDNMDKIVMGMCALGDKPNHS